MIKVQYTGEQRFRVNLDFKYNKLCMIYPHKHQQLQKKSFSLDPMSLFIGFMRFNIYYLPLSRIYFFMLQLFLGSTDVVETRG